MPDGVGESVGVGKGGLGVQGEASSRAIGRGGDFVGPEWQRAKRVPFGPSDLCRSPFNISAYQRQCIQLSTNKRRKIKPF
jgi:hypothetical protein